MTVRKKAKRKAARRKKKRTIRSTTSTAAPRTRDRAKPKQRRQKSDVLEKLCGEEAAQIVHALMQRHPDLREEAIELATALVAAVDARKLGSELGQRLLSLDIFDLSNRASREPWRHVEATESAYETLEEVLAPYVNDLERRIDLGLEEAARATCLGIVLGLYHARDPSDDSLLAHAPDFCEGEASFVVDLLANQSGRLHGARWSLPEGSRDLLPEWDGLFKRRPRRRSGR